VNPSKKEAVVAVLSPKRPQRAGPRTPTTGERSALSDVGFLDAIRRHEEAPAAHVEPSGLSDLADRHHFLKQLYREKRRTDRSKSPLSIALFRIDGDHGRVTAEFRTLVEILHSRKRETDTLGYLGDGLAAVLLTDTDAQGTNGFLRKIADAGCDLQFSVATATYPDHLFDAILAGKEAPAEFHSLVLPEHQATHVVGSGYRLKRALDVAGAAIGIFALSPVMLITAIAIATTSPGPVIFRQKRLGRHGRPFVFYKFRSMRHNNDDRIHREFVTSLIQGQHERIDQGGAEKPLYKLKSDPRVTRVGRFIRRTSIDELPQLFNVLKGDMSLVGPRPPLPYEVETYQSWHLRRILEVRPGLTGLWQVEGRSKTTFDEMVRMDLRYTRISSLAVDIRILVRTVRAVLKDDGAT
jgi:lipopolysaccharide/colanic/teichoic acid biosynthesis glycosyltransferase